MAVITMREASIRLSAKRWCAIENVFLMGEEVAEYQGAYKVTKGLLEEFGAKRVIDTPITELGFAGLGVGAAMVGLRPIIEFMTFNFSILATDQIINSAAKMLYMSGGQFKIPIVFRGPGGSAFQVSSQHSQALESWYAYFPGLESRDAFNAGRRQRSFEVCDSRRRSGDLHRAGTNVRQQRRSSGRSGFHDSAGRGRRKARRNRRHDRRAIVDGADGFESCRGTGESKASRCEVIDPRTIRPLDIDTIVESVKKTNRVVVAEESHPFCGVGAEISAADSWSARSTISTRR